MALVDIQHFALVSDGTCGHSALCKNSNGIQRM